MGKVCSGPVKSRKSAIRQRAEQGVRKEGGSGVSPTQQANEGGRFCACRSAHTISWTIDADCPGARSIARLAIIYLHQKMKTPRKGAPLILNIEMNITETGINPKTADELRRSFLPGDGNEFPVFRLARAAIDRLQPPCTGVIAGEYGGALFALGRTER